MKYIICRGCPASGKSTWAKKFVQGQTFPKEWLILNRDTERRALFNFKQWNEYKFTKKKEQQITDRIKFLTKNAADIGINIVDDNTNLTRFKNTEEYAASLGYDIEYKDFFDVHLHQLIERNLSREFSVSEDVIHRMFRNQLELQGRIIKKDVSKPPCVIVDIDGTVAEMGKGKPWGRNPYDWDKVLNDRPRPNVIQVVKLLAGFGEQIIFLSGRDRVAYDKTYKWLEKYVMSKPILYLRNKDDNRPDCIVKEEMLHKYVLDHYYIKYALEDRKQMTDHYRALGLEVWQVDHGRF